jgi:hypothetical protein
MGEPTLLLDLWRCPYVYEGGGHNLSVERICQQIEQIPGAKKKREKESQRMPLYLQAALQSPTIQ